MNLRQNALALIVLTVLIAIAELWSGDAHLAHLWQLPLGVLLLGLAYERWFVSRYPVSAQVRPQRDLVLGRTESITAEFVNSAPRGLAIEWIAEPPATIEADPHIRTVAAPPCTSISTTLLVTSRRLGTFIWPAPRMRVAGPLGFAWWNQRTGQHTGTSTQLRVVPDLIAATNPLVGARGSGGRAVRALGVGHEVLQLRSYRPGDPPHLIDWKASARRGTLISRDYSEDQHVEIVLAIDAGRASGLRAGTLDRLGHYANVAARFAQFALTNDDRVGVLVFADRPLTAIPPGRGSAAMARIRSVLGGMSTQRTESNPLNAAARVRTLVRQRSLIVLLTDLEDGAAAGQLSAAARLLIPKHLLVVAGLTSPEISDMAARSARSWLDPYEALAAQEYCATLERNVRALRQLGAPTLLSRPEQLEQAVFDLYQQFRAHGRI
jgi:uncharacterized protein (DUF58 family)